MVSKLRLTLAITIPIVGAAFIMNQKTIERENRIQTTITDLNTISTEAQEELKKENKALREKQLEMQKDYVDLKTAFGRVQEELRTQNKGLKSELSKIVGLEQISDKVAKAARSTLMTFEVVDGKRLEDSGWVSSLVKIDGKLYVAGCSHAYTNSPDAPANIAYFLNREIELEAFDKSYKFRMTPGPLEDGSIGFFPLPVDLSIFPLTKAEISKLPNRGRDIGFELEDMSALQHGSPVFTLANSEYSHSVHLGFVVHPSQTIITDFGDNTKKKEIFPNQIIHFGMEPGNSGAPLVHVLTGKQCGIAVAGEKSVDEASPVRGYSNSNELIKTTLANIGLNVLNDREKKLLQNSIPGENNAMNIRTFMALRDFMFLQAPTSVEQLGLLASSIKSQTHK